MRILITGAAGLVGGALVKSLSERSHAVVAIAHRNRPPDCTDAATWLSGDVRRPGLGLDASALKHLDVVVHCAAVTGFNLPAETYRAVNVDGTANVIALARNAGARLLHVSTAYVCGDREGSIAENELRCGQDFTNGYEASKADAEALVSAAGAAVARPSIVTGAWRDGAIAEFGGLYMLLRMIASGRIGTLPVAAEASLDLVPIDYVVAGLVDLAERIEQAAGQTFHLVSGAPVAIARLCGLGAHYPQFRTPRLLTPDIFDAGPLEPDQELGPVAGLYTSYLRRAPQFQTGNLARLSGRTCPPVDDAYLRRLIDYAISAGFLPSARPGSAAPAHSGGPGPSGR